MEKYSLDMEWKFFEGEINDAANTHAESYVSSKAGGARGGGSVDIDLSKFETVNLPHDFAVGHDFDAKYGPAKGYKARGTGWYFKRFRLNEEDRNKELYIEFGGVASHCTVYLNGSIVYRNFSGYNSFVVNITDMAVYGDSVNILAVYVDAEAAEGWWYEGAGIYRHVDLYKRNKLHTKPWGVFINPIKKSVDVWDVEIKSDVINTSKSDRVFRLESYILNEFGNIVGKDSTEAMLEPGQEMQITQDLLTYSPYLWDIDEPHLYTATTEIYENDECIDMVENKFGFRTIAIDKDNGFFLNGRQVQLYGTCNHQDHAGVGVAVPDSINEYRIQLLKEMGSNAYRCSHGNPTKEVLDLCDKYGLLVMDENRSFNTSPDGLQQVRDMVMRDRNHPSVVMYSLFNEEPLQGMETGKKLALRLRREIEKYDDTRFITGAMDSGWLNKDGAAFELDVVGFNYRTEKFNTFREKFPDMPMIGSESNSAILTRGIYKTDNDKHEIESYGLCVPWGNTHMDGFKQIDTRKHIMGMFIWTGFDYRGEPTPFEYPSISSQFGIMDTCGFKKDAFYLNKAYFTKEPLIHIVPSHWNFAEGETVKIMPYTNCEKVELFLNGESLGVKACDRYDMCEWQVEFKPGILTMNGINSDEIVCSDEIKTAGTPKNIVLTASRDCAYSGSGDAVAVNVSVTDENGICNLTADNLIEFSVDGGKVLGVGNGDPNSHEADKADKRKLFNGLCQAVIEPADGAKKLVVTAKSEGLENGEIVLDIIEPENKKQYIDPVRERYITTWRKAANLSKEMPDAVKKLEDYDMNTYSTVIVGNGIDEMFEAKEGYGIYKTSVKLSDRKSAYTLIFRKIQGDTVYVYINGELRCEKECPDGDRIELLINEAETVDIDVCIFSKREHHAGIVKPVSVY